MPHPFENNAITSDLHSVGDVRAVPRQSFHSDAGESKHRSSQKNKQETHMQLEPCGTKKSFNTDVERKELSEIRCEGQENQK
jgi:hypothetical protein